MPKNKADFSLCLTHSPKCCILMLVIQFLIAKLLKQGKIRKVFSKFYNTLSELIVKYNIGFKNSSTTGHMEAGNL